MTKEELELVVKEQLAAFENKSIKADEMNKAIEDSINQHLANGVTKEQFEELNKALEEQGLLVAKLKSNNNKPEVKSVKGYFEKSFSREGLVKEIQDVHSRGAGIINVDKAVGTVTTGSVTTDTGGNALLDMINADEINSMRLRDTFIEQYCSVTRSSKPVYSYVDYIPKEGDATHVAEGAAKPELDLQAVVRTVAPVKAAAWTELTEEAATDVPRMQSESSTNIMKRVMLRKQNGILFGSGVAPNPTGVTIDAPAFDAASWTGQTKVAPNLYDAMIAAKNQIELAENYTEDIDYYPNVCFLNPADYNDLLINQSDLVYTFNDVNGAKITSVDGIQVVKRKEIPAGKLLMGDFTMVNIVNYIDYTSKVGYVNDNFINNLFVLLGETRYFTFIKELDKVAFVYDDIATIITALTTV